jgi:hypothetical protein
MRNINKIFQWVICIIVLFYCCTKNSLGITIGPEYNSGNDNFGHSVDISEGYVIVGAYHDKENGNYSGSASIFKRSGNSWSLMQKIVHNDADNGDCFGNSVSIYGNYCIIGNPHDDDKGSNAGSAYIFKSDGESWTQLQKILASDGSNRNPANVRNQCRGEPYVRPPNNNRL